MTMTERRLGLTTPLTSSGQIPDNNVRVIVSVSLGVSSNKVVSPVPSASQIRRREGVHRGHLAS